MRQGFTIDYIRKVDPQGLNIVPGKRTIYYVMKRALDFSISLFALIVLFPLMVITAILIKIDSPGPILFKQQRVGARRKTCNHVMYWQKVNFQCYKFRTMVCDADPALHQAYIKALINNDCESMATLQGESTQAKKLLHDPRITRLGKYLRKSSIDELPQFINVLKGEMSLVGPRPAIPYEVEMYKPWHFRRLETKPGITGLWQVTARSSCDFDEIIKLDIQYVDQQSLWMDLKILLKTPMVVLFSKGAV